MHSFMLSLSLSLSLLISFLAVQTFSSFHYFINLLFSASLMKVVVF